VPPKETPPYLRPLPGSRETDSGGTEAEALNRFLEEHLPPGCLGAVRSILPGDEQCLTSLEGRALEQAVLSVRRASGAGRDLARSLCARIGVPVADIPRSPQRYPLWPTAVTGSIAHDSGFTAAVVAPAQLLAGIGIDIEPAESLSPGIGEMVASAGELASFSSTPFGDKALFSIKEAVFKAVFPHDRIFLDFRDVVVMRESQTATTVNGRVVSWRVVTAPRVVAVAWWR
jgi:4'-phosphopantetheinyl transferase EntD